MSGKSQAGLNPTGLEGSPIKTYQDLTALGQDEAARMSFIRAAINEHKASEMYKIAYDAELYDRQLNVTIMSYQKLLYTMSGKAVPDNYSANHKVASNFFNRFVTQENQYLLGNGVNLENEKNKEKLGKNFDVVLQKAGRNALIQAVCFGFWNFDHLEIFKLTEFAPLYDEENAALMAGVRFWQVAADKPLRATLFELDGYTDYIQLKNKDMSILHEKRPYKQVVAQSEADGTEIMDGENYPGFPVIPLWGNLHKQSELVGLRESIDAYDLIKSGFANDLDDATQIYWLVSGGGGMDDVEMAKLRERLKITHMAATEDGEQTISAHTVNIPYESRVAYLDHLKQDMYDDFQALNVSTISGGQKTATEITAAYQPFDNKVDQFEYCVIDFLQGLFKIIGIEDNPSFTRTKIPTQSEDMQVLMMAAPYLDDEYVTRKACAILGDPDAADEILKRKDAEDLDRLGGNDTDDGREDISEDVNNDGNA